MHVQGTPTQIDFFLDEERWYYGDDLTRVVFSREGLVTAWDNYNGTLKVRLVPTTSEPSTAGYFTRGSSQDDVLHVQGTPTQIDFFLDEERWYYGDDLTRVVFSREGLVTAWNNYNGTLRVR